MGYTKSEFQIAANKHYKRQMMKSTIEQAKKKRETVESELKKIAKLPCIPDSDEIYNFFALSLIIQVSSLEKDTEVTLLMISRW